MKLPTFSSTRHPIHFAIPDAVFITLPLERAAVQSLFSEGRNSGSEIDASSILGLVIKHNLGSWKSDWAISGLRLQTRQHACLGCKNCIHL